MSSSLWRRCTKSYSGVLVYVRDVACLEMALNEIKFKPSIKTGSEKSDTERKKRGGSTKERKKYKNLSRFYIKAVRLLRTLSNM